MSSSITLTRGTLDERKKVKFLNFTRNICNDYKLQYILILIDSDLPKDEDNIINFPDNEICLKLYERDDNRKLFKKRF